MATDRRVIVVSDLHIGGQPTASNQYPFADSLQVFYSGSEFAAFIDWLCETHAEEPDVNLELVLNGDTIDFSAEEPFSPLTEDAALAVSKMHAALDRMPEVCRALDMFLDSHRLTIIPGDRDVELCHPQVRSALIDALGAREDSICFIPGGQVYKTGRLLVEHGNQYDPWNSVDQDTIFAFLAAQSQGARSDYATICPSCAGAQVAAHVLNPLKEQHGFVNLLKPEGSIMALILMILRPELGEWFAQTAHATATENTGWGAGEDANAREEALDLLALEFSREEMAILGDEVRQLSSSFSNIGSMPPSLAGGAVVRKNHMQLTDSDLAKLRILLKKKVDGSWSAGTDKDRYQRVAAGLLSCRNADLVVFGHTHQALITGLAGGVYINTGTWAHKLEIPDECLAGPDASMREFGTYLKCLMSGDSGRWASARLTYADIRLTNGGDVEDARLCEFSDAAEWKD